MVWQTNMDSAEADNSLDGNEGYTDNNTNQKLIAHCEVPKWVVNYFVKHNLDLSENKLQMIK